MSTSDKNTKVRSMTGFSTTETTIASTRMRIEIKALNHRFLDLKVRLPRELSSAEIPLRAMIQAQFARGSVEVKVERLAETATQEGALPPLQLNTALATHYYQSLVKLQKALGLTDSIRVTDIISLPEVITSQGAEAPIDNVWQQLEPAMMSAVSRLLEMREHEGEVLRKVLNSTIDEIEPKLDYLRKRRKECEAGYRAKITEKVKAVFETYPIAEASIQAVLESRVAQELALLLDRTDIEEELTRFRGHLDHFRKVLKEGGPVGRKLDFLLQELNREVNTLNNKAQDFQISEETIQLKVRIEQLREQVMNLE